MSKTLTMSNELYERLEEEARLRGLSSIELLLEEWERREADINQRKETVRSIDQLRERLFANYGQSPDSTLLVREDRNR